MKTRDYEMVLDSLQTTGIYVIREDNHEILYYNKRAAEVVPNIQKGMICHEIRKGTCANCPLRYIGEKQEARSVNYDDPFGKAVEIAATRLRWEDTIPAFMITVTNLSTDTYNIVKADQGEIQDLFQSGLDQEEINMRNQEIINSLGDANFAVYVVDLQSGDVDMVRTTEMVKRAIKTDIFYGTR